MMGPQVMRRARAAGAYVLPLDSEHNAIFQCLGSSGNGATALDGAAEKSGARLHGVRKLLLTGSGGPFRQLDARRFVEVTPEQACTHPNWRMGRKISVDSATMMNKGLELIEACALFGIGEEQVEIVIHPQSTIHSMVEYIDGSVLAQLASPDMRIPIAHALAWPERIESGAPWLDLVGLGRCDFEPPDAVALPGARPCPSSDPAGRDAAGGAQCGPMKWRWPLFWMPRLRSIGFPDWLQIRWRRCPGSGRSSWRRCCGPMLRPGRCADNGCRWRYDVASRAGFGPPGGGDGRCDTASGQAIFTSQNQIDWVYL